MGNLQVRRGLDKNLPVLLEGEPGFSTDVKRLYIGSAGGENIALANKDELDDKILLNGEKQQKIGFIKDKVVQDGLIDVIKLINVSTAIQNTNGENFSVLFSYTHRAVTGQRNLIYKSSASKGIILCYGGGKDLLRIFYGDGTKYNSIDTSFKLNEGTNYKILFSVLGNVVTLSVNGVVSTIRLEEYAYDVSQITLMQREATEMTNVCIYNRPLTTQEVEHDFSVLNNTPSIKELHTTDSIGKTSILKFASDTDHVEDRTGETQEQINRAFYKRMCKEFASTDGSPITINNGEEGYVLSGEIKGQTVKNYCPTIEVSNFENYAGNKIENNIVTIHGNGAFSNAWIPYKGGLEPNKAYKCVAIIYENTLSGTCNLFGTSVHEVWQGTSFLAQPKQTGIIVKTLTTKQDIDSFPQISRGYTTSTSLDGELIKYSIMVLDENSPVPTSYIPFGLSSTQAIISNNSQEYPIYEPTIQGKTEILNGQLISLEPSDPSLPKLGSVEDVADTINMVTQDIMINAEEFKLSSTMSNWRIVKENVNTTWFQATLPNSFGTKGICNVTDFKFNTEDNKHVYTDKTSLNVFFDKMSLNDFKNYIDNNDIVIRSILTEPQKHQLTQEQLKAYDAHKKVISLPFAEDKLALDDEGSITCNKASHIAVITDKNGFSVNSSVQIDGITCFRLEGLPFAKPSDIPTTILSDMYNTIKFVSTGIAVEGVAVHSVSPAVPYLYIKNSRIGLLEEDTEQLKIQKLRAYLANNNFKICYLSNQQSITHIPKELAPTVLTHKANTWEVGRAVRASSFKIIQPVDRIAEIEARLQALESTTVDVVLNK